MTNRSSNEYQALLRDPRWQRKRLEILEGDCWTCQHCGATDKTLCVHHYEYGDGPPWETEDHLLQTLCEDCHAYEHKHRKAAEDALIGVLRSNCVPAREVHRIYDVISAALLFSFSDDHRDVFLAVACLQEYQRLLHSGNS